MLTPFYSVVLTKFSDNTNFLSNIMLTSGILLVIGEFAFSLKGIN